MDSERDGGGGASMLVLITLSGRRSCHIDGELAVLGWVMRAYIKIMSVQMMDIRPGSNRTVYYNWV